MSRIPGSMRAGANGSGGYTNGYNNGGGGGGYGQYGGAADDDYPPRPSAERRRDRRPGGYGGFSSGDREEDAPQVTRPTSLERTTARRRSGEQRAPAQFGAGSDKMEEILAFIRQNWDFMTKDKCVPIEVALKLMDSSSLGLANDYNRFQRTHQELQQALKAIVNGKMFFQRHMPPVATNRTPQSTIRASIALLAHSTRSNQVSSNPSTASGA